MMDISMVDSQHNIGSTLINQNSIRNNGMYMLQHHLFLLRLNNKTEPIAFAISVLKF